MRSANAMLLKMIAQLDAQEVATGKAWTAANFGRNTSDLIAAIKSGELNSAIATLPKVRMMRGGLVIEAGGSMLGAVGVAGAYGGEKDEACAKAALAAVQNKLDFWLKRRSASGARAMAPCFGWRPCSFLNQRAMSPFAT